MFQKAYLLFTTLFLLVSCSDSQSQAQTDQLQNHLNNISIDNLKNHVYSLASDEMSGRKTGEEGQKVAARYIRDFYIDNEINAADNTDNYYQFVPGEYMTTPQNTLMDSENVIAVIEGSEYRDEYVVMSAHYDHIGVENGQVMYGADDNGSGTAAMLEIGRVLQEAKKNGHGPKRTIVLLHCTGEEYGLHGSRYYTENALYSLEKTVANVNVDMIGRNDNNYLATGNYVYLIGPNRSSNELNELIQATNKKYTQLTLDYTYDALDHPEMLFYRSDHYNFAVNNIPVIFFFGGIHPDYHKPTDTADKILFDEMHQRTKLIFGTIWEIANREEAIELN